MIRLRMSVLLLPLATASACSRKPGPEEILRRYTDATLHGRVEEAWPLLCQKDRSYRPLAVLKQAATQLDNPNAKMIVLKTRFETAKVEIDGDHAKVTERFTGPDVQRIVMLAEANPENSEKVKSMKPEDAM